MSAQQLCESPRLRSAATGALLFFCLFVHPTSASAAPESAWDRLLRRTPEMASRFDGRSRVLLRVLSPEEAERFADGADAAQVHTLDGRTLEDWLVTEGVNSPEILWWTIDGGGGKSFGGDFVITASFGQPEAVGSSSGGEFTLRGGFWHRGTAQVPLFTDGFESGDLGAWSSSLP